MSDSTLRELLSGFPVTVEAPVFWGDMDAFQHVNNIVFFRYFESARIAYLGEIGFQDPAANDGVGPILAATHCRFRRPLTYPDRILVGARTTEVGEDRFEMEYRIASEKLGAVAAEGGGTVVSFDYGAHSKAPIPAAVREAIRNVAGRQGTGKSE